MEGKKFGREMYDQKYSSQEKEKPRRVVKEFIDQYLASSHHCLDLGCGEGRHSQYLAEKGIKVTGIDYSSIGVERTNERLKSYKDSYALVADAHHLPFQNESFDSMISNRVLDYNDDLELKQAFAEIERVLKDNAPVFLTLRSSSQNPKEKEREISLNEFGGKTFQVEEGDEQGAHQHYFTKEEMENLASLHHLQILEIKEDKSINEKGEHKAEWQMVLKKQNTQPHNTNSIPTFLS